MESLSTRDKGKVRKTPPQEHGLADGGEIFHREVLDVALVLARRDFEALELTHRGDLFIL